MTETRWKVDRSVPVATLLVLVAQTAGIVWWAASTSTALRKDAEATQERVLRLEQSQVTTERVGRIEEQNARTREDLTEIKADIKRLLDKRG